MIGPLRYVIWVFCNKVLGMRRSYLAIFPLMFAFEAHALTFKSGGAVNGGEPAPNSAEIAAAGYPAAELLNSILVPQSL